MRLPASAARPRACAGAESSGIAARFAGHSVSSSVKARVPVASLSVAVRREKPPEPDSGHGAASAKRPGAAASAARYAAPARSAPDSIRREAGRRARYAVPRARWRPIGPAPPRPARASGLGAHPGPGSPGTARRRTLLDANFARRALLRRRACENEPAKSAIDRSPVRQRSRMSARAAPARGRRPDRGRLPRRKQARARRRARTRPGCDGRRAEVAGARRGVGTAAARRVISARRGPRAPRASARAVSMHPARAGRGQTRSR